MTTTTFLPSRSSATSVFLALRFHVLHDLAVSRGDKDTPQINDPLDLDVLVLWFRDDFDVVAKSDVVLPIVLSLDRSCRLEQRQHVMPFDVVTRRMLKYLE